MRSPKKQETPVCRPAISKVDDSGNCLVRSIVELHCTTRLHPPHSQARFTVMSMRNETAP